ncbi:MAG: hypothetical protein H8E15_09990 [Planctomycetes bacterium]|nr:hypothetical protein [Planctomycetota bacterium]
MKLNQLLIISLVGISCSGFAQAVQVGPSTHDLWASRPPCDAQAEAQRRSDLQGAEADFYNSVASALNEEWNEMIDGFREAWAERKEALELVEDQYEARLQVCAALGHGKYAPDLNPAEFSSTMTNNFLPFPVGQTMVYEKLTAEGLERVEVSVLNETRMVDGIECRSVQDLALLDGELIESTIDWYAEHQDGSVWYMGEIALNYDEEGFLADVDGSWRTGVDGAQPGYIMRAAPAVGDFYRQEFLIGEAEDIGRVISLNETVVTPYGTFTNCLQTEDGSPIEPDSHEMKYYAPGIGLVLEVDPESGERLELVDILP